ncbi:uncharacterized protein [Typha angustifolia]|uniref:uncharacterized protein n=1 Tax=Typha angustifolia TaxID=59011 RepID=UPI003C2C56D6
MEDEHTVRLQIVEQVSISSVPTLFEPQEKEFRRDDDDDASADCAGSPRSGHVDDAPEKKLTLFALRLAILEKAASGLGALGFIWATVVLLGGFAITLERKDFWFITVILLIEGARIFSRSHELEWQHQATWSITEAGRSSFRAIKSSSRLLVRSFKLFLRPFSIDSARITNIAGTGAPGNNGRRDIAPVQWTWRTIDVLLPRHISRVFCWLQLLSASACVSLSLMRLMDQDFGAVRTPDADRNNRNSALNIFYGLALAEALLFLAEKAFWEWKVSHRRLLEQVNSECRLGAAGLVSIKRFFYDAYSKCVNGSIFDGLKMDLVSFAAELLASSSRHEQLIGARILLKFSTTTRFADGTLRKIGTSTPLIERLIEMLNWKNPAEEEIRRSVAVVVSKLAGKKQNALRVAGIPGAVESISSLLYAGPDDLRRHGAAVSHELLVFNLLGLLILKKLAHDHDNCGKIGNARGLLDKIISFTSTGERWHKTEEMAESQIKAVKRSLQVVKMLASTTGQTGKVLRQEISEIVFTVSNIREILQHAEDHMEIQKLGIEILTSLAMDEKARERIGSTGGMIKELLRIFLRPGGGKDRNSVSVEAGEALAMLAMESVQNCQRILKEESVVGRLVVALDDPVLRVNAARILRNLCSYEGSECCSQLRGVTAGIAMVLNAIMIEKTKLLEVSLGLAAQILRFMSPEEFSKQLHKSGITEAAFVHKLVHILTTYNYPSIKLPRIRRFVVELAIWLMKSDSNYIKLFTDSGMEDELKCVSETTSELECFNVFSGSVGLSRHNISLCSLVDTALQLMGM